MPPFIASNRASARPVETGERSSLIDLPDELRYKKSSAIAKYAATGSSFPGSVRARGWGEYLHRYPCGPLYTELDIEANMHRREPSAEQAATEAPLFRDELWGSGTSFGEAGALDTTQEIPPLARPGTDPTRRRDARGSRKRIEEYLERRRLEEALQEKLEDSIFRD